MVAVSGSGVGRIASAIATMAIRGFIRFPLDWWGAVGSYPDPSRSNERSPEIDRANVISARRNRTQIDEQGTDGDDLAQSPCRCCPVAGSSYRACQTTSSYKGH